VPNCFYFIEMKYWFFALSFIFVYSAKAQDWQAIYTPDSTASSIKSLLVHNDTIYAFWNRYDQNSNFGCTIIRMDTTGKVIDSLNYFETNAILTTYSTYSKIAHLGDQDIAICGNRISGILYLLFFDFQNKTSRIVYYNSFTPNSQWQGNTTLLATPTGLYLTGCVQRTDTYGTLDAFIIHTDLEGNEIWRKTYGQAGVEDIPLSIVQKSENEIIVGAQRQSPQLNFDIPNSERLLQNCFFAIDTAGSQLWEHITNPNEQVGITGNVHVVDGNLVYPFRKVWPDNNMFDWFAQSYIEARRISDFSLVYRTSYGMSDYSVFNQFRASVISPDSLYITVSGYETRAGNLLHTKFRLSDGAFAYGRVDTICVPDMVPVPSVNSNGILEADLYDIATLSSGSTISCGSVDAFTPDGLRLYGYIMKTNAWGQDLLDDCTVVSSTEPPQYAKNELFVYPNPATDHITIQVPEQGGAYRVRMYTSAGTPVREQVYAQGEVPSLDISYLSGGLYFVLLLSESGRLLGVGKVLVLGDRS
jgi:Secretion system C-terminal sorting domain